MRIGISLNGEGRGHLTRISAIAKELLKRHDIIFWVPGTRYEELKSLFPDSILNKIPAFEISYTERNQVDIFKTGSRNIGNIFGLSTCMNDISNQIEFYKPDILISDFEPIVPSVCKNLFIPVIQFNHPAVVLRDKTLNYDAFLAKFIAKTMCSHYDELIVSSFYSGDVGPIIRTEIKTAEVKTEEFILVYLKGSPKEKVLEILDKYNTVPYKVFPDKDEDFVSSLASCRAVITNGGHQLLSEAAFLNKPLFMLPIERQYEQILNAGMIEKAGRGMVANYRNMNTKLVDFLTHFQGSYMGNKKLEAEYNFKDNTEDAVHLLESKFNLFKRKKVS